MDADANTPSTPGKNGNESQAQVKHDPRLLSPQRSISSPLSKILAISPFKRRSSPDNVQTRLANLPRKSKEEEATHLKQYREMMKKFEKKQAKLEKNLQKQKEQQLTREDRLIAARREWEHLVETWDASK
jgi:hypothetical protein